MADFAGVAMVIGSGVDLIEVARVERVRARYGARFLRRTFAAAEVERIRASARPGRLLAQGFAAKEAAMKALGTGWRRGVRFRDIEVESGSAPGAPGRLRLHGRAAELAQRLGAQRLHVATCASGTWAAACVVLEGAERP